jgi:formate-dependent phosphoribosylglycinamide formyltransferase (GAR transformylase)
MQLYITETSPYARMARIVILEKGLQERVTIIPAQTRQVSSPYYAINPSGRVPYLVRDDGTAIEESALICAWFDHLDGKPAFDLPAGDAAWEPRRLESLARSMLDGLSVWAREIARAITGNLGGRGIFGVELFIKGDQVWFSEVSPRPHDTGLVTLCSQRMSEFELHARAILGLPVDVALREPGASAVIYGGMNEAGIAFEGVAEALAVPHSDLRLFGKPEAFIKRRMGVALANGTDTDQALR